MPNVKREGKKKSVEDLLKEHGLKYEIIDVELTPKYLAGHRNVEKFIRLINRLHQAAGKSKLRFGSYKYRDSCVGYATQGDRGAYPT